MTVTATAPDARPELRLPADLLVPALYQAEVTHRRRAPVHHRFRYRSFYWLTDVDSPPRIPWPMRGLAHFDPGDHDDPRELLAGAGLVADRVLRLAHARSLGSGFNPITVYWCYQRESLVAVIAEVHNTYGGRRSYLVHPDGDGWATVAKALYVSPFYAVSGDYDIRVSGPADRVSVTVTYRPPDGPPFTASLVGQRRPAEPLWLLRMWLRHPLTPWRTSALIRWQGIRLWLRGLRVQPR